MPIRVHADDLGLHPSVDRAIFRAFESGAIGGASILVSGRTFKEAAQQARLVGLPLSLHLAIVDTAPVSPPGDVPTLVGSNDRFPPYYGSVVWRSVRGATRLAELRLEIERQLQAFAHEGLIGQEGLIVDGHQHLHLLPAVFDCLLTLAPKFRMSAFRLPLRSPDERERRSPRSFAFMLAELFGRRAQRRANLRSIHAIPCWGVLYAGRLSLEAARAVLSSLPPNSDGQLLCHPGDDDVALAREHPWGYSWETELATVLALAD